MSRGQTISRPGILADFLLSHLLIQRKCVQIGIEFERKEKPRLPTEMGKGDGGTLSTHEGNENMATPRLVNLYTNLTK